MYSVRLVEALMLALSVASVTEANWLDTNVFGPINNGGALAKRQQSSSSGTARPTTASNTGGIGTTVTLPEPTTTAITSPTDTAADETITTTIDAPPTTTDDPSPTNGGTTRPTTQGTPPGPTTVDPTGGVVPTTAPTTGPTTGPTTEVSEGETPTTTLAPVETTSVVTTRVTTLPDGRPTTTTDSTVFLTTPTAGFSSGQEPSQGSNLTQQQKDIIIGVCVGVGGAIVLGVGALLFWRLRKKRQAPVDNDEITGYGTGYAPGAAEKTETSGSPANSRSPFQSTLESYHAPTQTNAASNF